MPISARAARPFATLALLLALLGTAACSAQAASRTDATGTTAVTDLAAGDPNATAADPGDTLADAATFSSFAARIITDATPVHVEPSDTAAVTRKLGLLTSLGSKMTLLVVAQRDGWVQVALPTRPNGSTGWIKTDDVELRGNVMAITVDLAAHQLTIKHNDEELMHAPVAIGSSANPTPKGQFFVTDLVDTGAPGGSYGPFALGLSGHSDTLSEFAGGDGQIGLHGTNDPSSIGQSVSHGCVRVTNDIVEQLAGLVPLGTPVTIV
jgi:lipoprotein-anchoring transpeptidase ErfK/SrfK